MLHTIFLILKIIGIILLSLLLLSLLLLILPFSYIVKVDSKDKVYNLQVKVCWMLSLIHFKLVKDKEELKYKVKLVGITIYKSKPGKNHKEDTEKNRNKEKKTKEKVGIKGFFNKIKNIFRKIKDIYLTLVADSTKRAFKYIKKIIIHLIRHLRPRKIKGSICFGFEEPHITGQVLGYIAIGFDILNINPKEISIEPDFENKTFVGSLMAKGRFVLGVIIIDVLKIYFNQDVKGIINKFSKEA